MNQFNQKKAEEIIEKYNLPKKIKRIWKFRGEIPMKYFKSNFFLQMSIEENSKTRKIREILEIKALRLSEFRTNKLNKNYTKSNVRLYDIKKGSRFVEGELLMLKDEITEIRNKIRKIIDTKTNKSILLFLSDTRIKPTLIISRSLLFKFKRRHLDKPEKDELIQALSSLYNRLRF